MVSILSLSSCTMLLTLGFPRKSFRSQDINLVPLRTYEMVLLISSFDSKRDAAGDDESSGYSSLSPPTINLTLHGSYFSGR